MSKHKIKNSYDVLGGRIYDIRYAQEQEEKYLLALKKVKPNDTDIILDNGCGTGLFLINIESIIVGVDFSHELLKQAAYMTKEAFNKHLVYADSENLPFRNSTFDKVYSFTVIHNLTSKVKGVSEMMRVSKSDASLVITGLKKAFSSQNFQVLFRDIRYVIEFKAPERLHDFFVFIKKTRQQ